MVAARLGLPPTEGARRSGPEVTGPAKLEPAQWTKNGLGHTDFPRARPASGRDQQTTAGPGPRAEPERAQRTKNGLGRTDFPRARPASGRGQQTAAHESRQDSQSSERYSMQTGGEAESARGRSRWSRPCPGRPAGSHDQVSPPSAIRVSIPPRHGKRSRHLIVQCSQPPVAKARALVGFGQGGPVVRWRSCVRAAGRAGPSAMPVRQSRA